MLLHLALGTAYARAIPPWEAPDEPWHAAYALALAVGRLPTAVETYEHHHPPLAYAWTALGVRLAGIAALPVGEANPRYPFAAAALAHPPHDARAAPVRFLRGWGAVLAVLAVPLAFAAARAAGLRGGAALGAAVVVALWPQFVFLGHTVSNDGLATVAGAGLLYAAVLGVRGAGRARWAAAAARASAAAAVTVKLNAAVLVPAVAGAGLAAAWARRRQGMAARAPGVAVAAGVAAGAALGVGILAVVAPSTIDALAAQTLARTARSAAPVAPSFVVDTLVSLWARFGWANVDLPWIVVAPAAVVALAAARGLPRAVRRGPAPLAAAGVLAAAAVAAFAASSRADPQPQGRLLFPALPALALVTTAAWASLPARRWRPAVAWAALGAAAAAHAAALAVVLPRAYAPVGDAGEVGVAAVVRHLPVGGDAVSTVVAGAPHAMVGVAARAGLGRIEVPVIFQTAGALRLTVSRVDAADSRAAELAVPLDKVAIGAGVHERAATRPRPWHGESRVRPVWLGVDVAGLGAGERYALTLEAADGAVVTVWRAQPDAGTAGAAANDGSGSAGSAEALARIELYDP